MASLNDLTGSLAGGAALGNAFLVATGGLGFDVKDANSKKWLFAYRGEDSAELESDITDHYVEDNAPRNDHIALRPEQITLHGFVGELSNTLPGPLQQLNVISSQLSVLSPFQPKLVTQATAQFNQLSQTFNAASSVVSTLGQLFGIDTTTEQQDAYNYFYQRWKTRTLFTVQTPWTIFESMAIKSLRAIQDEETQQITEFVITFKKFNTTFNIITTALEAQARRVQQSENEIDQGTQVGSPTQSLANYSAGGFVGVPA